MGVNGEVEKAECVLYLLCMPLKGARNYCSDSVTSISVGGQGWVIALGVARLAFSTSRECIISST